MIMNGGCAVHTMINIRDTGEFVINCPKRSCSPC